jgi:glyoxylase I family protein
MHTVLGLGGVFFKASDPAALSAWYEKNLGITLPPQSYDAAVWEQQAGPTIFAPTEASSELFTSNANLCLNFRVADMDAMCEQLRANGVEVTKDDTEYPNGTFASLSDPEGNPIQLWQFTQPS